MPFIACMHSPLYDGKVTAFCKQLSFCFSQSLLEEVSVKDILERQFSLTNDVRGLITLLVSIFIWSLFYSLWLNFFVFFFVHFKSACIWNVIAITSADLTGLCRMWHLLLFHPAIDLAFLGYICYNVVVCVLKLMNTKYKKEGTAITDTRRAFSPKSPPMDKRWGIVNKLATDPLQNVAFSHNFCWLFVI